MSAAAANSSPPCSLDLIDRAGPTALVIQASQALSQASTQASTQARHKGAADGGPYPVPGAFDQAVTAALSPGGTILAAGMHFGYGTYLYDVATGKKFATLTDPGGDNTQAPALTLSPDGKMVAVTDANARTYPWRLLHLPPAA